MPFGLCNAPATFQRAMDKIFRGCSERFAIPYFDDIIIFSTSLEEHIEHLETVFCKLKAAGISLNHNKCHFAQEEIKILGHIITKGIVKVDPEKIRAIKELKKPATVKDMRSFLWTMNLLRDFLSHYAEIVAPLNELIKGPLKKSSLRSISWNSKAEESFSKIKSISCKNLSRFQPDFDQEFTLTTDASDFAIGGILSQIDGNGNERMIRAFSKSLDKAQKNYSVTDK